MSNINKTVVRTAPINLEALNKAIEFGLLSVLIAQNGVKLFTPVAIVAYPPLPAEKEAALAANLRNKRIPFAAYRKELQPTLGFIPAAHLAGQQDAPKVYPQAKPATRPVISTTTAVVPFTVSTVSEVPPAAQAAAQFGFKIPGVTPVEEEKTKKVRKPRAKKDKQAVG